MKKYIYTLIAALFTLASCTQLELLGSTDDESLNVPGDGKVTLALDLKLANAEVHAVETRSNWASKENVSEIKGYALVFGDDLATDTIDENSPLLQKVAFKTVGQKVYITFKESTDPCYIHLITTMTQGIRNIIDGYTIGTTTLDDYKHLQGDLGGYYENTDMPDPANLTDSPAFPLASPGIQMPNGLTDETVAAVNKTITMVPMAAKIDVTSKCNFTLNSVTLLNGAKIARVRSTAIKDDGSTIIESLPLPFNLGGTVQYAPVYADGITTAATPIYLFPNDGDLDDKTIVREADEVQTPSDPINKKNPTYLIIEGEANGFGVVGYYKIPIVYDRNGSITYDILRSNHYKVNITSVNNAGYATFDEAVAGPANDINYDITIGGGNSNSSDTFTDPRAETIVSHNGFFHIELVGSEIIAQGYEAAGVKGSIGLSLTRNNDINTNYDIPTLSISATEGITIDNNAEITDDNFAGAINFTATKSGTITLRCGDMLKTIPVHYTATPHVSSAGSTIGGISLGSLSSLSSDADDTYEKYKDATVINISNGEITTNNSYKNREFRGKAYPSDMSKGIRKVYVVQASNFMLFDKVTNTEATKNQTFIYQSTGNLHKYNNVDVTNIAGNDWRSYTIKGDIDKSYTGDFSKFPNSGWKSSNDFSINPTNIGENSGVPHIENSASLTLTNIAGETKLYSYKIEQYARPYQENTYTDNNGRWIFQGGKADVYGNISGNNRGDYLTKIYFSNCTYTAQENYGDTTQLGYHWEDKNFNVTKTATDIERMIYALEVKHFDSNSKDQDPSYAPSYITEEGRHLFVGKVKNVAPVISRNAEGYFVITLGNAANERIKFYIYYTRRG